MASKYTANYGLSLWEPGDQFLRAEFNGDHERLEAALGRVEGKADRALKGLEPVVYNVYNLALRDYYGGKSTEFKRALIFDGFLEESRVSFKSGAIQIKDGAARLSAAGQGSITTVRTGAAAFLGDRGCGTGTHTAVGGGTLRSITFEWYVSDGNYPAGSTLAVTLNDVTVRSQSVEFPVGGSSPMTVTLTEPVALVKGDRFSLALCQYGGSRAAYIRLNAQGTMAGTIGIDPLGAGQGTLTAAAAETGGSGEKAVAFVRYAGGSVIPTLNGRTMARTGRRTTVNLQGEGCTEDTFEGPETGGSVTMGFTLSCGSDAECVFYDYGVVVI